MKNLTNQKLEEAIIFATEKHSGTSRKGNGLPYIVHPIRVMHRLMMLKEESHNIILLMIVALLHDTVEDCDVTLKEIAEKFGYKVAALVEELTLDKTQYEKIGKAEYLLRHMLAMSTYALRLKLCDRIDNIIDTKSMNTKFKKQYKAETEYILNGLTAKGARKLTPTHMVLIKQLKSALKQMK